MSYVLKVEYNELSDEYYIILPELLLKEMKWNQGDKLEWKIKRDNSIVVKKVK